MTARVQQEFDVIVIGGGITGYVCGILLRRGGLQVGVVEGFPWEWWRSEEAGLDNFSGGILYGVPGHRRTTALLIALGIPLNNPHGEGPVSFRTMVPAYQVLLPRRWVNLHPEPGEAARELERLFPGSGERAQGLYREAVEFEEKMETYWPSDGSARRKEGNLSLSSFLDGWAASWQSLFGGRLPSSARVLEKLGSPLAGTYGRLFFQGLDRRLPEEVPAWELYHLLEVTSQPSCLINETGQRGIRAGLHGTFQRQGGVVFHDPDTRVEKAGRHGFAVGGSRNHLSARWVLMDVPEERIPHLMPAGAPRLGEAWARPAIHVTLRLPWEVVPAGMGCHLVMNLDGGEHPLLLTLGPTSEGDALLEVLTVPSRGPAGDAEEGRAVVGRLSALLRFLPDNLPEPVVRRGSFPSHHGGAGILDRWGASGPFLPGPNVLQEGNLVVVGRGDYLGSDLGGALRDGQALAWRLLGKRHPG